MKNIFSNKNRKGIAPLFIVLFIVLILIAFYVILFIPIPAFTKMRMSINYFLIIIFWIIIQVGFIYGYYQGGRLAKKYLVGFREKMMYYSMQIRHYIIRHY